MKKILVYITILVSMLSITSILNAQIQIPSYTNTKLSKLSVLNNKVYISGPKYLRQSSDGGATLIPVSIPLPINGIIKDFHQLDANNLYIIISKYTAASNNYDVKLYHSIDAGQSWINILSLTKNYSDYKIHFFDSLEGVMVEQYTSSIYRTINGGNTWTIENNFPNILNYNFLIHGDRDSTLYISADECGIASTDRGKKFKFAPNGVSETNDISVLNRDTIFVSSNSSFYYTFEGINYVAGSAGPFIGWRPKSCGFIPTSFCYKAPNELYFSGQDANNKLKIAHSPNLSDNWTIYNSPFTAKVNNMKFINDSIAMLCGDSGKIFLWNKNQPLLVIVNDIGTSSTISDVSLSPNPSSNQQTLSIATKEIKSLQIYLIDYAGKRLQQMFNGVSESGANIITLNIAQIPNGIYFYEVKLGDTIERIRFVKS